MALIDAYWRGIVGIALLYGIWSKRSHQRYGIEVEWVYYGIPEELSLGNAWAHQARDGALIERFFGNLSQQFCAVAARRDRGVPSTRDASIVAYQHTPHCGLGGMTQHEKWVEGLARRAVGRRCTSAGVTASRWGLSVDQTVGSEGEPSAGAQAGRGSGRLAERVFREVEAMTGQRRAEKKRVWQQRTRLGGWRWNRQR